MFVKIKKEVAEMSRVEVYWQNFLKRKQLPLDTQYFEAFYFGHDEATAMKLLALVLSGKKIATSSAKLEYVMTGERVPKVGDYSIVTGFKGVPQCVIQTKEVLEIPFNQMTFDLCQLEGEDLTLESWQEKHIEFFQYTGNKTGYTFSWDMIIIFEQFEVVFN